MIAPTKKQTGQKLPTEGEHEATLSQVSYKNENKKCLLGFETRIDGTSTLVTKECQNLADVGPLRRDLEVLNGADFTSQEIAQGIDPEKFIGKQCRAVVVHKRTSGGRLAAIVNVILPLLAVEGQQASAIATESIKEETPLEIAHS